MLTELGKFLRKIRIDNGELLKEMANNLKISPANLSAIENGKRNPQQKMITTIIKKYKLNKYDQEKIWNIYSKIKNEISLSFDKNLSEKHRNVGLVFIRQFNQLSTTQVEEILNILKNKD